MHIQRCTEPENAHPARAQRAHAHPGTPPDVVAGAYLQVGLRLVGALRAPRVDRGCGCLWLCIVEAALCLSIGT